MKLYRAIEFSKLSFMLSAYGSKEWNNAVALFKKSRSKRANWWFDPKLKDKIEYIIADIIANGHDHFFESSMTYNSINGGRFNPPNSFGIMYTASNPALASLEVLFHIYNNKKKFLAHVAKSGNDYSSTFDETSPEEAKNLMVVFCINAKDNISIENFTNDTLLKDTCSKIGFKRYTDHADYDENFIFGNNYEISRILGCHLHTNSSKTAYKFKSARIDNSDSTLDFFNVIFPETYIQDGDLSLEREYFLVETHLSVKDDNGLHKVKLKLNGNSEIKATISLENHIDEKKIRIHQRLRSYRPNIPVKLSPALNSRRVLFQRFRDEK